MKSPRPRSRHLESDDTRAAPEPEPVTYDVPADIPSDCSSDVTPRLLAWLDATPDNSVLRFGADACYEIEGVVYVNSPEADLRRQRARSARHGPINPTEGVRSPWPRRRAHWWFAHSVDISISNVSVTGSNPNTGQTDAQYNNNSRCSPAS